MKHINNYSTLEEANNGVNFSPNVSLIENQLVLTDVGEDKPIEFKKTGDKITGDEIYNELTFKAKDTENSVQLKWTPAGLSAPAIDMEVSINDGEWRPYEITDGIGEVITLAANDTVKFRGNNETLGNVPPGPGGYWQFVMTGIIEAHGNIMSLLDKSCERTDVPPAAFFSMFNDCSALIQAPSIPATTLADRCYYNMFQDCTSLTTAPELPATELTYGCYSSMFQRCTSLTTAPELPATTLDVLCYSSMFDGCTSLTVVPGLPATTLIDGCYSAMFEGCSSLTELTVYADDISASGLDRWLDNTASGTTGILHSLGSADFTGNVPSNWSVVRPYQPGYIYVDASEVIPSAWEDEVFIYGWDESTSSPIYGDWQGTSMEYDSSLKLCKIQIFGSYDTLFMILNDGSYQTIDITLHNITVNNSVVITIHNVITDAGTYNVDYLIY